MIISRGQWGARYAPDDEVAAQPASEVWLHHSATTALLPQAPLHVDAAAVREVEAIGQARFGHGISYTFVVAPSGRVFEGHGVTQRGTHTGGRNTIARAVCLLGDYETSRPTRQQLEAVAWLLVRGAAAGWWRRARLDGGHRDAPGAATACPGRHAHAAIAEINQLAQTLAQPMGGDMTTEQARQLAEIHAKLHDSIPNRRGPGGATIHGGGADDPAGYAVNADGFGFRAQDTLARIRGELTRLHEKIDTVVEAVTAALAVGHSREEGSDGRR